jgi:hypothetical protein
MALRISERIDHAPRVVAVEPDAAQVAAIVNNLTWTTFTTVVLGTEDAFLEISGSGSLQPEDGLAGRRVDATGEYVTCEAPTLEVARRLLEACASKQSGWQDLVAWE